MKKAILISLLIVFIARSEIMAQQPQISVSSSNQYTQIVDIEDIDAIVLINGINSNTNIRYTGDINNIEWRKFDNSFVANTYNFSPDDATGYVVVDLDNNSPILHIWVIDYSLYRIDCQSINISGDCQQATVTTDCNVPELVYYDKNNTRKTLTRNFTATYTDYSFNDTEWTDSTVNMENISDLSSFTIPAPKKNIELCILDDQYSTEMGISRELICCSYNALKVESHLKGLIEKRSGENESQRDDSDDNSLIGSGPLMASFKSNANVPVASFFEWKIYKTETPNAYARYSEENLRYSFRETGDYIAYLKVSNGDNSCFTEDSIRITVLESLLDVPNAFSPNGDGINDEFRVVFKSLKDYKIIIFNRWGRIVYKGTNPSEGWDGKINGKLASPGTYYYVIEATGTDVYTDGKYKGKKVKHKKKGHINLFR